MEQEWIEEQRPSPEMDVGVATCYRAWCELGTCRSFGMQVGPIPWTAARQWCELQGFDDDDAETIIGALMFADSQWLAKQAAKASEKNKR